MEKYGSAATIFGVTDKGVIVPYGQNPQGIDIDWKTATVLEATQKKITIRIPNLTINTDKIKELKFINNKFTMTKKDRFFVCTYR